MTYSVLGWLSASILSVLLLPFLLTRLNKHVFKTKEKKFFDVVRGLRRVHKPLGGAVLLLALGHAYLIFGRLPLQVHTGTVLFASLLLTGLLGASYAWRKNKRLLKIHRACAALVVLLFLLHRLWPAAFS